MKMPLSVNLCFGLIGAIFLGSVAAVGMDPFYLIFGAVFGAIFGGSLFSTLIFFFHDSPHTFKATLIATVVSVPIAYLSGHNVRGFDDSVILTAINVTLSFLAVQYFLKKSGKKSFITGLIVITFMTGVLCWLSVKAGDWKKLPDDLPGLMEKMGDHDMQLQWEAAHKIKENFGFQAFIDGLHHLNPTVRRNSAHWLMDYPGTETENALIGAADDKNEHVRAWVAFSLGRVGTKASLETLKRLSQDQEVIVKERAQEALYEIELRLGEAPPFYKEGE